MLKIILTGVLGKDPELKKGKDGASFVAFSVSHNYGSGEYKKTMWLNCTTSEKLGATILQYTEKGSRVLIEGTLGEPSTYKNKEGELIAQNRVTVYAIEFLSKKQPDVSETESNSDNIPY